jgi:hypothetical protein
MLARDPAHLYAHDPAYSHAHMHACHYVQDSAYDPAFQPVHDPIRSHGSAEPFFQHKRILCLYNSTLSLKGSQKSPLFLHFSKEQVSMSAAGHTVFSLIPSLLA